MFGIFRGRKKEDREYYCLLKKIFGLRPNNIELYKLALLHRSASQYLHDGTPINNERLEFLGDAVIESVVSDYLFVAFPHENEGFLTQMRSRLVNRAALNELCREIGLSDHICSNASGGVMKNINGDAFEAMVGAMYLDKGYDYTNRTLIRLISNNITLDEVRAAETDFKSRLIEWCQKRKHHIRFTSRFENSAGKNGQVFRSAALIDGAEVGYGLGASKKEAEQHAAYSVLQALDDNMGDMILEMVDKSLGDTPPAEDAPAAKPKRRHRGGQRHRKKTAARVTEVSEKTETAETVVANVPAEKAEKTSSEKSPAEGLAPGAPVRETTVHEAPKRRRGRPRKTEAGGQTEAKQEQPKKPSTPKAPKAKADTTTPKAAKPKAAVKPKPAATKKASAESPKVASETTANPKPVRKAAKPATAKTATPSGEETPSTAPKRGRGRPRKTESASAGTTPKAKTTTPKPLNKASEPK